MLVDTDVLIWYMRGNLKAKRAIERLGPFSISVVNYMELVQGLRNKQELRALHGFMLERNVSLIHLSQEISQRAVFFMEQLSMSRDLRMADALIAATAATEKLPILTANTGHYSFLNLELKRFRP